MAKYVDGFVVPVPKKKLEAYGISITQVKNALAAQNLELPGGRVDQGSRELVLRTMGRMYDVNDFKDIIIAQKGNTPVFLRDVGRVENSVEEPRSLSRRDGEVAVAAAV